MEWTLLSCVLFAITLSIKAQLMASSPQENKSHLPDPAALFNSGKPAKVGTWLLLKDYMDQEDSILKEQLKSSHNNLKELFSDRYSDLKQELQEGDTHVKEQQKEGDERLNEELDEDVAWLKDKLAKGQTRMKEEIAEAEAQMKEELSEQKEAFEELKHSSKQEVHSSSAMVDDLKQQMLAFQEELKSTKLQLQTAQDEIHSLKLQHNSQSSQVHDLLQTSEMDEQNSCAVGSTFVRWGHTSCPTNTSLVYSGVAGGSRYSHTGGAANYLCLVMDPQLDSTSPPAYVNYVYGAEYDMVDEHDEDVVCSVCWAPQSASLMVPATTVCPSGWTIQYTGYLMSASKHLAARTEYVCVDGAREARDGGSANSDGALFYPVFARCGSLPCPPYSNKAVTCVVCSR